MSDLGVHLEPLLERATAPRVELPVELETAFAGPFRLPERIVYGNFVTSIDGIAAIEGIEMSSATISGGEPADRFVMALLRCVADAVVVGSGTLREHGGPWTAERAFPDGAELFGRARASTSASEAPTLVVATGSGNLPVDHPAVRSAAIVTTPTGARTLDQRGVRAAHVIEVDGETEPEPRALIQALQERGHRRILVEGGPSLMGSMLERSQIEELFLTISPKLLGGGPGRPPLTDEADLLGDAHRMRLIEVRRSGDYLVLRYSATQTS